MVVFMDELTISGSVENIIYTNSENGYTVLNLLLDDEKEDVFVCCVGYLPDIVMGESLTVVGRRVRHPSYGDQLEVISYQKSLPVTEKAIERYLSSGIVKGIGKRIMGGLVEMWEDAETLVERQAKIFEYFNANSWSEVIEQIEKKLGDSLYQSEDSEQWYRSVKLELQKMVRNNTLVA